jgi:hypothetical protein
MSVSLAEALGQVDLEPGQVYRCIVKGHLVELRVLEPTRDDWGDELGAMLDPWVELPQPVPTTYLLGQFSPMPLPDAPEIPVDEDEL